MCLQPKRQKTLKKKALSDLRFDIVFIMLKSLKKIVAQRKPQKHFTSLASGGQKRLRLEIFGQIVKSVGGDSVHDRVALLNTFLKRRESREVRFSLQNELCGDFLNVVENIKKLHSEVPSNQKAQYLSLVSSLGAPRLRKLGFKFSDLSFKHAREHARNYTPGVPKPHIVPPSKKEKSQDLKKAVYNHLFENSAPMANSTSKINNERVPSRGVTHAWDFLYHDFCAKNPVKNETVSKTTWDKWRKEFKVFKKARKQTDKCEICSNGKSVIAHLGRLEKQYPGITAEHLCETFDENDENFEQCKNSEFDEHLLIKVQGLKREKKFFEQHFAGKNLQREAFNKEVDDLKQNLAGDKAIVILDFKQNVALNGGPVELSHQFFQRSQRTVLGFVVLQNNGNGSVKKTYVNFLSAILNHDALFVSDCMKKLTNLSIFSKVKNLSFWTDAGPHFRCGEFAYCLFETLFSENKFSHVSWSIFVEKHGKNLCDTHFSSLSKWLKNAELKTHLTTTEELVQAWKKEIADENFVSRQKGKPERHVIFQVISRNVLPRNKNVLKIPMIKSLYAFSRARNEQYLRIKTYSADKNYKAMNISEMKSVVSRGMNAKLKRAPKFPKLSPHFSDAQIAIQDKGQQFRDEQNSGELSNLLEKSVFFHSSDTGDIPPPPPFSAPPPPITELIPENFVRPSAFERNTPRKAQKCTNKRKNSTGTAKKSNKRPKISSRASASRKRSRDVVSNCQSIPNPSKKSRKTVSKVVKPYPKRQTTKRKASQKAKPNTARNVTVRPPKRLKHFVSPTSLVPSFPEKLCDFQNSFMLSPPAAASLKKRKSDSNNDARNLKFARTFQTSHRFQTRSTRNFPTVC